MFRIMIGRASRPSAFQAGHIPSWHGLCESYALSPVAGACRWLLLLLARRDTGVKWLRYRL